MSNIFDTPLNQLDKSDINSYWVLKSNPRPSQVIVQEWIQTIPKDKKYIICKLPVGAGKSPLALNLSAWFSKSLGDAYVLTPQKILQKQYEESFDEKFIRSLYGKSNYTCESKNTDCHLGSMVKPSCPSCPYTVARSLCNSSPNVVLNYTLALLVFNYLMDGENAIFNKRKTIICDEAHTLEHHLCNIFSIDFTDERCKDLGVEPLKHPENIGIVLTWLSKHYMPALTSVINELLDEVKEIEKLLSEHIGLKLSKDDQKKIRLLDFYNKHKAMIESTISISTVQELTSEFCLVTQDTKFTLKSLFAKKPFKSIIDPNAERIIFLSATILNVEIFCENLGIDISNVAVIDVPSEFPEENRPVYFYPAHNMKYKWQEDKHGCDNMINTIIHLLNDPHATHNGIIHTGSFYIAKWLATNLRGKIQHDIVTHNPEDGLSRDDAVEYFLSQTSQPKVLISPSITEGLDLKDDKGRFAIFAKIPYPSLADAWIKRRVELSNTWYTIEALTAIIQGAGRVVRSVDDHGTTYILDSGFKSLYNRSKRLIPHWWQQSYFEI